MAIDAKLILKLRQMTSAGFLDCKNALAETNNDFDKAIKLLREKGIAKAIKKADRQAAEGMTYFTWKDNYAVGIVLNCETDFVAKNEKFINLVHKISEFALNNFSINNLTNLLNANISDITWAKYILETSSKLGENLVLSNVVFITKKEQEVFGIYNHINNKISAITVLSNATSEIAKNIAMHVSAINPVYISINDVDKKFLEQEKEILLKKALEDNNKSPKKLPDNIISKKVEGQLRKILAEKCLLEQAYVKEPSLTVANYLKQTNSQVSQFNCLIIK